MSYAASRSYADALALLEALQSNRMVVSSISSSKRDMNLDAIPEMLEWTRKAGYEAEDFSKSGLKCIHVAGTKGKGSVCAIVENVLLQYRRKDNEAGLGKIGLYTSPHLLDVRERIRIDGSPISESLFTQYFFELWDRFSEAAASAGLKDHQSPTTKPGYFRYLTIMAFHTFIQEGVESAIIECGIGGEYDSTNILPAEAVTVSAITRLGIDHVGMLGDTIEKIAWHKAGIMKKGVPAFTVKQEPSALNVLHKRAAEKSVELRVVERFDRIESGDIQLGLEGDFQKDNASLAITVASSHLGNLGFTDKLNSTLKDDAIPEKFVTGLQTVSWPGRCQVIIDGNTEWFIDGAHTKDSIIVAAEWFRSKALAAYHSARPPTGTMLIFNQQDRDAQALLTTLLLCLSKRQLQDESKLTQSLRKGEFSNAIGRAQGRAFTYAAFCTNTPFKSDLDIETPDISLQQQLAKVYMRLEGNALNMAYATIEEAVDLAYRVSEGEERILVLVTGSLYLAGGLLKVLEKKAGRSMDAA
jgi:folylpolyglutamate synthase